MRALEVAKAILQKRSHGTDSRRHGRGARTSKYGPGGARQPHRNLKSIISLGESVSEPVTNSSDLPIDAALVRLLFSSMIVYLLPISLNPNSESGSDIADAAKLPRWLYLRDNNSAPAPVDITAPPKWSPTAAHTSHKGNRNLGRYSHQYIATALGALDSP